MTNAAHGMAALRVLHVTPYFAPAFAYGGPPRSILGLCRALEGAGVRVQVLTTTANGAATLAASPPEGERWAGVRVRYLARAFPRRLFGASGLGRALAAEIPRHDLVHLHGLWHVPGWMAARRARRAGVPYVISPRGMLDAGALAHHRRRKRVALWAIERRHLAGAALLHAASRAEAESLALRVPGVPVVTWPNGVDAPADAAPRRGEFRRRIGLGPDAPLIAFVGRLHPIKRLDVLASAFAHVRARHGAAHLAIAGPDEGGYRRRVEPFFAPLGAAVHWLGEIDEADKWALLADADALALCSDSESFGLSVLEAMAAAVPVVVARTVPWPEIEACGSGFWVPHDPRAIGAAIARLLDEPLRARAMGDAGRALARARYAWDAIGRGMAAQYGEIAARARRLAPVA